MISFSLCSVEYLLYNPNEDDIPYPTGIKTLSNAHDCKILSDTT